MLAQFSDSTPKITLNPDGNEPADVCIANISPRERRKRMQFGMLQIVFGLAPFWQPCSCSARTRLGAYRFSLCFRRVLRPFFKRSIKPE